MIYGRNYSYVKLNMNIKLKPKYKLDLLGKHKMIKYEYD